MSLDKGIYLNEHFSVCEVKRDWEEENLCQYVSWAEALGSSFSKF